MQHFLKTILPAVFCVLTIPAAALAVDYYVEQNNPAAQDQNAGTIDLPWKTIAKANATLVAGDTVHIKAGAYIAYIAPSNSGSPAGLITYKNFEGDQVTLSDAPYGIHLNAKSNIVVQGIHFTNMDKFLWLENSSNHNVIAYCTFDKVRKLGWSGSKIYKNSRYNWIHHNRFSHAGNYTTDDIGSVIDIGDENVATDYTSHNLLEDNAMFHGGHHVIGLYGMYNVLRNNYFHNETWLNGHGNRVVYLHGYPQSSGRNLIQDNQVAYSGIPPDNGGGAGISIATSNNIVRRNRLHHNNLAGVSMTTSSGYFSAPTRNKIYSNTFLNNGYNAAAKAGRELVAGIGFARYSGGVITGNAIKNNIFHMNPALYGSYNVSLTDQIIEGNWEEAGDPLFLSTTPSDPMIGDNPDLRLQPGSPCIDRGTHLTTVASPAGSGTVFQVADAGYFMNGWGIVEGDYIQFTGTLQKARILDVNYDTSTITVDTALSWGANQGVSLAYEGAAPDFGAFEFTGLY